MGKVKAVLSDHVKNRRKLVPPFLAAMGDNYKSFGWAQEIAPEFLWIALLIRRYGLRDGTELSRLIGVASAKSSSAKIVPHFCRLSSFSTLNAVEKKTIVNSLSHSSYMKIVRGLFPLHKNIPNNPLSFLFDEADTEAIEREVGPNFENVLNEIYDRHSQLSAFSAATANYIASCQGKLHMVGQELADKRWADFEAIPEYPDTDASKSAAGAFRASAPMLLKPFEGEQDAGHHLNWLELFWSEVAMNGRCAGAFEVLSEEVDQSDPLTHIVSIFRNALKAELSSRLEVWKPDLNNVEAFEVMTALLARQATIALEFANSPAIWTPNSAPTILRSMADVYINYAWIARSPDDRSKQFIDHGLGAVKLEIAHREQYLTDNPEHEDADQLRSMLELSKEWLEMQRMEQFVEVNLGNWTGLNTRKMAEEAECLDFYNYVYQPFSNAVHSSWAHIGKFNSVRCSNPSHRAHGLGTLVEFDPDPHWLYLVAKYWMKTLKKCDEGFGKLPEVPNSFDLVIETINRYSDEA